MSFLPTDWPSFAWGAAIGAIAAFSTGFLQKAGEQAFLLLKEKVHPSPLEPLQVDRKFSPSLFAPGECSWVKEERLHEYEEKGFSYYPHPNGGARCYRLTSDGSRPIKEFLLVQPGAKQVASA
jgi:hypothetical protein